MKNLKVVYMGTPKFSVPILEKLINNVDVKLVVSRKDSYKGRKRELTPSPLKKIALENNIKVIDDNLELMYKEILNIKPDLIITAAFGVILPKQILDIPKYSINVHASLLPKYRGASPIYNALLNGDLETGISIIEMNEKMDAGDIFKKEVIKIEEKDNLTSLENKLSYLGAEALHNVIKEIYEKEETKYSQDHSNATYTSYITRKDERLDFRKTGDDILNKIRALSDRVYPYIKIDNLEIKIIEAKKSNLKGKVNTVIDVSKKSFTIMSKDSGIEILKLQPKGKKVMQTQDFLNGYDKNKLIKKEINCDII